MEINSDQKAFLQSIEGDIESAFLTGVTQSGDFLPKLNGYETIPPNLRPQGRQGILSTFAALLKGFASFRPTRLNLAYEDGFGAWPDANFQAGSVYLSSTGEVVVEGLCYNSTTKPAMSVIATLPSGHRPAKNLIFPVMLDGVAQSVRVMSDGRILTEFVLSSANPISLTGIRFLPA